MGIINQSQFDYQMANFKHNVWLVHLIIRDYLHDECLMCSTEYDKVPRWKKNLISEFDRDFKIFALELIKDIESGAFDIRFADKKIDSWLKDHRCRMVWTTDEHDCLPLINSIFIRLEDLHFDYLEDRHDAWMAEMAETHGMGYGYLNEFNVVCNDLKTREFDCVKQRPLGLDESDPDLPF